jgi:hypothetical protein
MSGITTQNKEIVMTPKFNLKGVGELSKLIGAIGKRKVALDKAVQDAAVQCVAQSIVHRNATPAMELFVAMQGSMRRDALVSYMEKFGNLGWDKTEKKLTFRDNKRPASGDKFEAWMEQASNTVWYTTKKESPIKSEFDAEEVIERAIDSLHRAAKRGAKILHPDALRVVESAYAQFKAMQLQAETSPEVQEALEARAQGKATPAQLARLTEHFSRKVGQVQDATKSATQKDTEQDAVDAAAEKQEAAA